MSKQILVVDDSPLMRKMMTALFTDAGHQVIASAKSGQQAIEYYQKFRPDIVTMDVIMNNTDGITAAKEIIKLDSHAKILFLSNLNEEKYPTGIESINCLGFTNKQKSEEILAIIESN